MIDYDMSIISLGAGVQSSTMALMAAHEEITPMPNCAVFADTGYEPQVVYDWLEYLTPLLPFPVYTVSSPLSFDRFKDCVPLFSRNGKGVNRRQCTAVYKIRPITAKIRELLGLKPGQHAKQKVEQWVGITTDEVTRMKPSRFKWITNRFPLAMEKRMDRNACLRWMKKNGYAEPPRSACVCCPFRSDNEWRTLKGNQPDWQLAIELDARMRNLPRMNDRCYVHRSCVPLKDVSLSPSSKQFDMWPTECDGICNL